MSLFRKKKEPDDSWLYILLISTVVILGEALKSYTFTIKGITNIVYVNVIPFIVKV